MKRLVCTNNIGFENQLTIGKNYNVEDETITMYTVFDDLGCCTWWIKSRFEEIKEDKHKELNKEVFDNKTKPTYYGKDFDVIDFCQKNNLDFMQGNAIKYVTRYKEKNGKEDLLKAKEYIDRMIKEMED